MQYNPRQIIDTAHSFFLAAERSLEQRPLGPGQFQMLIVPAVVCRAFAIELYFKAIITLETGSATGHDLSALFTRLSANAQSAIRTRLTLTESDLRLKLNEAAKGFVEWRYIFELKSATVDVGFLSNLANATKIEAETMLANNLNRKPQ